MKVFKFQVQCSLLCAMKSLSIDSAVCVRDGMHGHSRLLNAPLSMMHIPIFFTVVAATATDLTS